MVPVGVVDEGAKAVGGVMVTAAPAVGINPGEGFHVVADACCDSGERFAGVGLGARIPADRSSWCFVEPRARIELATYALRMRSKASGQDRCVRW